MKNELYGNNLIPVSYSCMQQKELPDKVAIRKMMMNTVCRLFYFYFITREKYVQVDLLQVAHV